MLLPGRRAYIERVPWVAMCFDVWSHRKKIRFVKIRYNTNFQLDLESSDFRPIDLTWNAFWREKRREWYLTQFLRVVQKCLTTDIYFADSNALFYFSTNSRRYICMHVSTCVCICTSILLWQSLRDHRTLKWDLASTEELWEKADEGSTTGRMRTPAGNGNLRYILLCSVPLGVTMPKARFRMTMRLIYFLSTPFILKHACCVWENPKPSS